MTSTVSRDLGHGVRVVPGDGGSLIVLSESTAFGWRIREDGRPGSAVMIEDESFEVVAHQPWGRGGRWSLEPWAGEDVMRVVFTLDEASVAEVFNTTRASAEERRFGFWILLLSPLLGFADADRQLRWRDRWGFSPVTATWLSALLEAGFGAACLIQTISAVGAGNPIFPWIPTWLALFGLYLFAEGLVRVVLVSAASEPVGSLFGFVTGGYRPEPTPAPAPAQRPEVQLHDRDEGSLALLSPIQRRDWEEPGLLPFRGQTFSIESVTRQGEGWVYCFTRVDVNEDWNGRRLRLVLPRSTPSKRSFADSPGVVKTVLLTIACTLARARFQERWGWLIGTKATWFTIFGAGIELLGGLSNLGSGAGAEPMALLVNLFFVFEAVTRIGWVVLRGEPLGSVIGLPLSPLLEKLLPE